MKTTAASAINRVLKPKRGVPFASVMREYVKILNEKEGIYFKSFVRTALRARVIAEMTGGIKQDLANLATKPRILNIKSNEKILSIFCETFAHRRLSLLDQLKIKAEFERNYLLGDFAAAKAQLEKMQSTYGHSIWAIENTIYCIHALEGVIAAKNYCESIKKEIVSSFLVFLVESFLAKIEGESPELNVNANRSILNEFRMGGELALADCVSYWVLPYEYDHKRVLIEHLGYVSNTSTLDQYLYFEAACIELRLSNTPVSDSVKVRVCEFLKLFNRNDLLEKYFNDSKLDSYQINENIKLVMTSYTLGNYAEAIELGLNLISEDIKYVSLIGPLLKSAKLSNYNLIDRIEPRSPLAEFSVYLIDLLSMNPNWEFSTRRAESFAIKYCNQSWISGFLIAICETFPNSFKVYSKTLGARALCSGLYLTPKYSFLLKTYNKIDFYSYVSNLLNIKKDEIPEQRRIKNLINSGVEVSESDISSLDKTLHIMPFEHAQLKLKNLLAAKKETDACELAVNYCLNDPLANRTTPIDEIIERIKAAPHLQEACGINYPILQHIFERLTSNNEDSHLGGAYESYMEAIGYEKPSVAFSERENLTREEQYFLRNICVESVMDVSPFFQSTDEIHAERIKILKILMKNSKDSEKRMLEEEQDRIITTLFIEKSATEVKKNKIDVDVKKMLETRSTYYKQIFEAYLITLEGNDADGSGMFEYKIGDEDHLYISDKKDSILARLIYEITNDFAANADFGLNKYLSADIRHGFFLNHLRARPENLNLITDKSAGEYESNIYWREKYSFINLRIVDNVDKSLRDFSESFDKELLNGRSRIDVSVHVDSPTKLFSYYLTYEKFSDLKKTTLAGFDEFIRAVLDFLWGETDKCLVTARSWLHDEYLYSLDNIYAQLMKSLEEARLGTGMIELDEALNKARSGLKDDIMTVISWLHRTDLSNLKNINLDNAIRIAINCFQTIYLPKVIPIEYSAPTSLIETSFNPQQSKHLILALVTGINNAREYGKIDENHPIRISCFIEEPGSWKISIFNYLMAPLSDSNIKDINSKLEVVEAPDLSTKEGGTGLYKIKDLMRQINSHSKISIETESENFTLFIGVYNENPDC